MQLYQCPSLTSCMIEVPGLPGLPGMPDGQGVPKLPSQPSPELLQWEQAWRRREFETQLQRVIHSDLVPHLRMPIGHRHVHHLRGYLMSLTMMSWRVPAHDRSLLEGPSGFPKGLAAMPSGTRPWTLGEEESMRLATYINAWQDRVYGEEPAPTSLAPNPSNSVTAAAIKRMHA